MRNIARCGTMRNEDTSAIMLIWCDHDANIANDWIVMASNDGRTMVVLLSCRDKLISREGGGRCLLLLLLLLLLKGIRTQFTSIRIDL